MELATLRQSGIKPTDDEIVWLASLGAKVAQSCGFDIPTTVNVGNITLHPQTVQASIWLQRYGAYFTDMNGLYAVAFALSMARTPGAFADLTTFATSVTAVHDFMEACTCTAEELADAVTALQDSDAPREPETEDEDDDPAPHDYSRTIASVVAATGIDHDKWNVATLDEVADILLMHRAMTDTEFDVTKHESRCAMRDFLRALAEVRKAHNG